MKIKCRVISILMAIVMASSVTNVLALTNLKVTDNGNGTVTVTGSGAEKIAVTQHDTLGFLKTMGISATIGGVQSTTVEYDSSMPIKVIAFDDWDTLKADTKATKVGKRTISAVDFDSEKQGAYVMYHQGVAQMDDTYETTDKNGDATKAMYVKRTTLNGTSYNAQFAGLVTTTSDAVVYEYDFNIIDANTSFDSNIKPVLADGSSGSYPWQKIITVSPKNDTQVNVVLGRDNAFAVTAANEGEWHTVSVVVNYSTLMCDYYYDGTFVGTQAFHSAYDAKLYSPDIVNITGTGNKHQEFMIDNFRVYEGTHPRTTIDAYDIYFDVEKDNIEAVDYTNARNVLNGKLAFHLRSGNTYDGNGNSEMLADKPYEKNGEVYVPVAELCKAWGISAPAAVTTDADGYGKLSDLAYALDKSVYTPESDINSGLVILTETFDAPTGVLLQKVNDYVFYLRPTKEDVAKLYSASEMKGQHPRIMATQADFDRVRDLVESGENEYINAWAEQLIEYADDRIAGFDDPTWQEYPKYEKYDGLRMDFQRETQNNLSLWGMAYHITGEKKYVDYAWKTFQLICDEDIFPDWNPGHHLDTCEAMTAVSIGYDWFYNVFTPEQRKFIEEGMYRNGILQSYPAFLSNASVMGGAYTSNNNHGVIDNGAAIVTSLAFMDVYPRECEWMMSAALELMENSIYQWNTGMWYEGPNYWELTMMHTVKFISAMQTALGTDLGYSSLQGLDISAKPQIASHGYWNTYNWGDTVELRYIVPELIWLANQYNDPAIAEYVAEQSKDGFKQYPDTEWWKNTWVKGEDTALGLLWYDPVKQASAGILDMDTVYYDENLDILNMRNTWDTEGQVFVGLKGRGGVDGHSNLDSGSFVFESDGIRWVRDVGTGSYDDSTGYFEWNSQTARRWREFATRAESHSTVVVNPEANVADHVVSTDETKVAELTWDDEGKVATVDMSKVLFDVTSASRKFKMVDNNQSLVIQDEITLDGTDNTIYWFLMTAERRYTDKNGVLTILNCEVEEVENGFILTQEDENGVIHKVRIDYVVSSNGTLSTVPKAGNYDKNVVALFEETEADGTTLGMFDIWNDVTRPDGRQHQSKRLELKLTGVSGDVKITAKITPLTGVSGTMTSVTDYVNGL